MKNPKRIKIIKRRGEQNLEIKADQTSRANTLTKEAERKLANRIGFWVRDKRERQNVELLKIFRSFFGQSNLEPKAA